MHDFRQIVVTAKRVSQPLEFDDDTRHEAVVAQGRASSHQKAHGAGVEFSFGDGLRFRLIEHGILEHLDFDVAVFGPSGFAAHLSGDVFGFCNPNDRPLVLGVPTSNHHLAYLLVVAHARHETLQVELVCQGNSFRSAGDHWPDNQDALVLGDLKIDLVAYFAC